MSEEINEDQAQLPPASIWNHIAKISIIDDKPIMLDYWLDSLEKKVLISPTTARNKRDRSSGDVERSCFFLSTNFFVAQTSISAHFAFIPSEKLPLITAS